MASINITVPTSNAVIAYVSGKLTFYNNTDADISKSNGWFTGTVFQ